MRNIDQLFNEFIADESGLTAVEYAVAGGLVVGVLVTAFTDLGGAATDRINELTTSIGGTPTAQ